MATYTPAKKEHASQKGMPAPQMRTVFPKAGYRAMIPYAVHRFEIQNDTLDLQLGHKVYRKLTQTGTYTKSPNTTHDKKET